MGSEKIVLTCVQCDAPFELSSREIERCESGEYDLPRRCPQCRKNKTRSDEQTDTRKARDKKKHYRIKYAQSRFEDR